MLRTSLLFLYILIQFTTCAYAQSITLTWDPNSESNLAGYDIYRSEANGTFPSQPLNGARLQATTFTDSTVQPDRTYYYVVTAVSTTGVRGPYSNQVQATAAGPPPNTSPPSGLVGHWKFDEGSGMTASDSSSSAITGTLRNGPIWTAGKFGNALRFDGADDYVNLGRNAALNFGTGSFTYSLWVNVSQSRGPNDMPWSKGGSSANSPGFGMELGTGGWIANAADGVTSVTITFGGETLNQWVLVTAVLDRSANQFRAYRNGALVTATSLGAFGSVSGSEPALIGNSPGGYPFNGIIDDVRVYNRALSSSEIQDLYAAPPPPNQPPDPSSSELVGHWKFDEGSGVLVSDSSSSGITGTRNGPIWTAGKFGNALGFDGADDFVNLGKPAALNFGAGSFTYSLWVHVSQSRSSTDMAWWKGGSSANSPGFDMELGTGGWIANAADGVTSVAATFGGETLNQWVLVTAVLDRSANQFRAYRNGELVTTTSLGAFGSVSNSEPALIGNSPIGYPFNGIIDDVRVYNRALSSFEIQGLYSAPLSPAVNRAPVVNVSETLTTGFLEITPPSGGATPSALAVVGYHQNGMLVSEAAFQTSGLMKSGRFYAAIQDSVNTGIAIFNPNAEPVTMDFYFTDASGANLHAGRTLIPANEKRSAFLSEPPFAPPAHIQLSSVRTFTFSASLGIAATVVRAFTNERSDFLITSLPIAELNPPEASPTLFPYYADGAGWQSEIQLVNPTDSQLSGVVQFFPGLDSSASDFVYEISPRSSVTMRTMGDGLEPRTGWVRVNPQGGTPAPLGSLVLSYGANGITISQAAIHGTLEASSFYLYAETSGARQGERGSVQTGLVISNPATGPADLHLELFSLDGKPMGRRGTVTVGANTKMTLFLDQIPGMEGIVTPFKGFLRIEGAPTVAVGLKRSYTERGDSLITPMPAFGDPVLTPSSEPTFLFFAYEGGYRTQFIDFNYPGTIVTR